MSFEIHVNAHPQDVPVSEGQDGIRHSRRVGNAFSTAVMLAQHSSVDGRANERLVDETDVSKVRVGQKAYVTADAFARQKFSGRVVRVGQLLGPKKCTY